MEFTTHEKEFYAFNSLAPIHAANDTDYQNIE